MLSPQQAASKEAAHRRFGYPTRIAAEERGHTKVRDTLPRFRHGVAGIGIAGDTLRVYVLEDLATDLHIPHEIEGLRAERVLTTGFRHQAVPPRQTRLSPAPCGVSIGHAQPVGDSQLMAHTGTLGCLVDTPVGRCILSNNHVLAGSIGDYIYQPGPSDAAASGSSTRIAALTDFERLRFGGAINRIDAAIAGLHDVALATPDIMTIGLPANPPVAPALGQAVVKHGRTTGLTFGSVVDTSFDGDVYYDGNVAYFEDQIVVVGDSGPFSEPGDSGSLVLDTSGPHPVGLLFAGDDSQTIANPIQFVLNRFGATVAVK
ncbi:MAG: hypothetical protein F4Y02_18445 [Chloroflexi bacterium]|nr:hypothetical protein [Chloroflexota bacterium]